MRQSDREQSDRGCNTLILLANSPRGPLIGNQPEGARRRARRGGASTSGGRRGGRQGGTDFAPLFVSARPCQCGLPAFGKIGEYKVHLGRARGRGR